MSNFQRYFPFDQLPKAGHFPLPKLQAAVQECINDRKVPVKMPYYAASAASCAAAQPLFDVHKPAGGRVGTNLFALVNAGPGERKTHVRYDFFRAFDEVNTELKHQFKQAMSHYQEQDHHWKREDKILVAELGATAKNEENLEAVRARIAQHYQRKPMLPCQMSVSMKEPKYAPLMRALTDFPCTTIVSGDCASYLRDTILPLDTLFCDTWSAESIDDPRVSVASYWCENPRLSMFLMLQPEKLKSITESKKGRGGRDSGLFGRTVYCDAGSTQGGRFLETDVVHSPADTRYRDEFNRNLKELLLEGSNAMRSPDYRRKILRFGKEAARIWVLYHNYVEEQSRQGGRYEKARDCASKLADNVARMAAGFHVAERFEGVEIGMECLMSAIALCDESSADYVTTFVQDPDEVDAMVLYDWLVKKLRDQPLGEGQRLRREHDFRYVSTVSQYAPGRRMRGARIHALLATLARKNLIEIRVIQVGRGQTVERIRLIDPTRD
ncbi:DUF3987 domain-containing protein [Lysobacter claricitrinus]|uniref:DUF3987 domain-containing protein n=1 Tax=Lysobacter claricitrinus TaxID=3367728 RepID=UPI0037DAAA87